LDFFDEELLSFFSALENQEVKYILVGGYAVNLHGYSRFTGDLDIWLKDDLANRKSCEMGDFPMIERMQFLPGWTEFHLNNSLTLDIMTEMKGLETFTFEECFKLAAVAHVEGIKIPFLHLNQLIDNKKAVDRPKDQTDVVALEKIKRLRDEGNDRDHDPEPPHFTR
jgi:hypothetical protein